MFCSSRDIGYTSPPALLPVYRLDSSYFFEK